MSQYWQAMPQLGSRLDTDGTPSFQDLSSGRPHVALMPNSATSNATVVPCGGAGQEKAFNGAVET